MTLTDAAVRAAKTSGVLLLLAGMMLVPILVYTSVPRASAWFTTTETSTAATTYSGRAFGASFTAPMMATTFVADTGPLPPSGGTIDATAVVVPLPAPFTGGDVLLAVTMGFDNKAQSQASTSTLSITLPAIEVMISVDSTNAESTATCNGVSGSSDVGIITVGGQSITADGTFDQTVSTLAGTLVLNEQIVTSNGITVNAFDLTTANGFKVIISSAESDITCAASSQSEAHDFVTGGGWIPVPGGKGTFGFVAGFKDHSFTPSGHLTYIDHPAGTRVQSTSVTSYTLDSSNQRTFAGTADLNGASGYTYSVTVQDNGEPGTGHDTFNIQVFDSSSLQVYAASGTLGGGNIEIHN